MSYFAVTREAGPAWVDGGVGRQPALSAHTAFMEGLADDAFVLFAGPVSGTEQACLRVVLVVQAESEAEIHRRLADDPWTMGELLRIASIEPWNIVLGAARLA